MYFYGQNVLMFIFILSYVQKRKKFVRGNVSTFMYKA